MAKKLSPDISHSLNHALSSWLDWTKKPLTKPVLSSQLGGQSNHSFMVSDGISNWVIRLNSSIADEGRDLQNEVKAHQAACRAGIAPSIVYFNSDFLITEFLEGNKPGMADLPEIGQLFSLIHSIDVDVRPLDLMNHLETYFMQAKPDLKVTRCFNRLLAVPSMDATDRVLCHQDLTFENMIRTQKGIVTIDWEYASLSDPAFDLAVFTYTHNLDEKQRLQLLGHYDGNDANLSRRIRYFEMIYAMIEILWWQIRGHRLDAQIGKLDRHLEAY